MSLNWEELEALHQKHVDAKWDKSLKRERNLKMLKGFLTFTLPLILAGFVFFCGALITKNLLNHPTMDNFLLALFTFPVTIGLTAAIIAGVFTYQTTQLR